MSKSGKKHPSAALTDAQVWEILLEHHKSGVTNTSHYTTKYGVSSVVIDGLLWRKATYKDIRRQFEQYIKTDGRSEKENVVPKFRNIGEEYPHHDIAYYYHDKINKCVSVSFGVLQFIINLEHKTVTINTNDILSGDRIDFHNYVKLLTKHEIL